MSDKRSQYLSFILRHKPSSIGLRVDNQGWMPISDLIEKTDFTEDELKTIVAEDEKGRYSISPQGTLIRANQGHSLPHVRVALVAKIPPTQLWHGTKRQFMPSIMKQGLLPLNRNHVHLSTEIATAEAVGNRRSGETVVLLVDTVTMVADGIKFYRSDNGIWLVEEVPSKYLSEEVT